MKSIIISTTANVVYKDDSQDQEADDDKQKREDEDHCTLETIVDFWLRILASENCWSMRSLILSPSL